jgi:hypothetical protein
VRLTNWRHQQNQEARAAINAATKAIPTGPVTAAEVRDLPLSVFGLLQMGLKSDEELRPDFKMSGGVESRHAGSSIAECPGVRQDVASGSLASTDSGISAPPAQSFSETHIACDGLSDVWGGRDAEVLQKVMKKDTQTPLPAGGKKPWRNSEPQSDFEHNRTDGANMKARQDVNLDLMTLPELVAECSALRPKLMGNTATVRDARRFAMLHSLVIMFEQAKRNCGPNRKSGENIGMQVKQDLIRAKKDVNKCDRATKSRPAQRPKRVSKRGHQRHMSGEQEHYCGKCNFEWEDFKTSEDADCPNCRAIPGTPAYEAKRHLTCPCGFRSHSRNIGEHRMQCEAWHSQIRSDLARDDAVKPS